MILPVGLDLRIGALVSMTPTGVVFLSMLADVPREGNRILLLVCPLQKILLRLGLEMTLSRMLLMSPTGVVFLSMSIEGGTFLTLKCRQFAILSAWSLFPAAELLLCPDLLEFLNGLSLMDG